MLWALSLRADHSCARRPDPLPHRGEAGWHPPGRERLGRLLAVLAALQRDQRTQRAPDRVGRKLERLARGWGP